jgi:hypothetical protein
LAFRVIADRKPQGAGNACATEHSGALDRLAAAPFRRGSRSL